MKVRKRKASRSRSKVAAGGGQASYVRGDDWLTPVTLDERSAAYRGAMPSKTGKRASDKGFLGMSFELYSQAIWHRSWNGSDYQANCGAI